MIELADYIVTIPGLVPVETCDELVNEYGENPGLREALIDQGIVHPNRSCDLMNVAHKELDLSLYLAMGRAIDIYRTKYPDCRLNHDTGYVFLRYKTGQYYKQHTDHYRGDPRLVTISIALNDGYEGGEWAWFNRELVMTLKKGDAVMFPSNWMFPHEITPVTNGTRYTIVTWFTE